MNPLTVIFSHTQRFIATASVRVSGYESTNRTANSAIGSPDCDNKGIRRCDRHRARTKGLRSSEGRNEGTSRSGRDALQSVQKLLQSRREAEALGSKARREAKGLSFSPLFFIFSDYRFIVILQAIDDICYQVNPLLAGALLTWV